MKPDARPALLVVDVQNDFCAGGALEVPNAAGVVEAANRYIAQAGARGVPIYLTRCWHPAVTKHFKAYGGLWPAHCVQGTSGARFHRGLAVPAHAIVVSKGDDPTRDAYSAFDGHTEDGTAFLADLRARGVGHVFIAGLATDYCVRQTSLDALAAGLQVTVLDDAVAGVSAVDSASALGEMLAKGARMRRGPDALAVDGASWEHYAHGADIGIRGIGPTRESAFEQIALALTAVVTDLDRVRPERAVTIECEAPGDDLLLVDWLNALVYTMATERMLFSAAAVSIVGTRLHATVWGEPVDRARHEPAVEVKGATYTTLRVERQGDGRWVAQSVVDV